MGWKAKPWESSKPLQLPSAGRFQVQHIQRITDWYLCPGKHGDDWGMDGGVRGTGIQDAKREVGLGAAGGVVG